MNTRKKILLCITKPAAGGAQKYVYDLATHLPINEFETVVIAGSPRVTGESGGQGPLFDRLRQKNIHTIPIPASAATSILFVRSGHFAIS